MSWRFIIIGGLCALLSLGIFFYIDSDFMAFEVVIPSPNANESVQDERELVIESASQQDDIGANAATYVSGHGTDFIGKGLEVFTLDYSTKDTFDRFIFERTSELPRVVKLAYSSYTTTKYTMESAHIATDLFSRYVDYKVALSSVELEVDLSSHTLRDITYKLDERENIRRRYFADNEYHYLFSQEAQIDEAALARLSIAQEDTLSKEERKALIVDAIKTGDRAERDAFQPTLNMHRINEIKTTYSNANDRFNAVAAEFGTEVAQRFAQTWEEQAQWQKKIEAYTRFRDELMQQGLSPASISESLVEYQVQHFTANEIKRLKVLTAR